MNFRPAEKVNKITDLYILLNEDTKEDISNMAYTEFSSTRGKRNTRNERNEFRL